MAETTDLLSAFIEFADTIVAEYDVVEFLHRLALRCVELLDTSEAGIMLANRDGTLHYVASSSERMRLIELCELQHDEGPCMDAYHSGVAVRAVLGADSDVRWPRFSTDARDAGFASVSAIPMRLRDEVIGALNLFSTSPEPLDDSDERVAQALADIATISILQERALNQALVVKSQLELALDSRVVIEQAKGIVAERSHITVDAAFATLRGYARRHNRLLSQTAQDVVSGALSTDLLVEDPEPRSG